MGEGGRQDGEKKETLVILSIPKIERSGSGPARWTPLSGPKELGLLRRVAFWPPARTNGALAAGRHCPPGGRQSPNEP